ncbi:hypothetical protein AB0I28_24290 [Phytomonospora sp. NPDC050363]|uniref:hypothetical protein n=1 Tax=Phytomonospora sp. NPDC050363 TaxID=3155642 RepID=UPI0033F72A14
MNLRLLAWIVLPVVGLILVGWLAIKVLALVLGWIVYVAIGAAVVVGAIYAWGKVRQALGKGPTRRSLPR